MPARTLTCPYCGGPAALVDGRVVYPHRPDLADQRFWRCAPCDAYVGCHRGTTRPMGRLADASLRDAKMRAHAAFDRLWQLSGMTRKDAYRWLARALGISTVGCHIGEFDLAMCLRVVDACDARRQDELAAVPWEVAP